MAYTRLILSRVRAAISPEPATFIARSLHRRLPDRIRGAGDVQLCTGDLCQALSEAEAHDTRALFVPGDGVPELPDFARMTTLHALDVSWVRDHGADFVQGFLLGKLAPAVRS